MAQRPVLPLGSGLGQIRAPSLQGDANEAAFMNQTGALQKLLGMYPTQAEAIAARKRAQEGIVSMLNQVGGGATGMGMPDESLNIDSSTPQTRSIGSVLSELLGPSIVDRKLSQASDKIFGAGPKAKPTGVTGGSFAFNELDIFSPDAAAGIAGQRMPLTGGGDEPGDATFGGRIPEDVDAGDDGDVTIEMSPTIDDDVDVITSAGTSTDTGTGVKSGTGVSPSAAGETTTGTAKSETQDGSTGAAKTNAYEQLLASSLQSYNDAMGRAPSGAKSMDEYKKEFSEATGIDISGDPDNKAALTAFGLALMQNKAGKGFNVGNILSEVGAAGEKALPLMEAARKEARAGKLAAGQYALSEAKTANQARQQFLVDQSNYLTKRRDTILDAATARMESIEDREDKQSAAIELAAVKTGFDRQIKLTELDLEGAKAAAENKVKTTDTTKITDPALQGLEIVMGNRVSDGRAVFKFPAQNASSFGTALADVQEGISGLDEISNNIRKAQQTPGGTTTQKALEFGQGIAASFGFDLNEEPQFDKEGNFTGMAAKPKPLTDATVIRDRIISQFKRFLTQETGNGISNVDIKNIERLLGNVDFLGDPNTALKRVEEAKKIFLGKKDKLVTYLDGFSDKTRYINDQEYLDTRKAIDQAIAQSYSLDFGGFQKITDEDTGLEVYKIGG